MMKKCPNCGKKNSTDFCGKCGFQLTEFGNNQQGAEKPKKKMRWIKYVAIFWLISCVLGITIAFTNRGNDEEIVQTGIVQTSLNLPKNEAEKIEEILKKCAINDISEIKHDEMLDDMDFDGQIGFRIRADGRNNIILYTDSDYNVDRIRYNDKVLYEKGNVKIKITEIK